jgi:pimeloyl-ACP methyl ester carboxylesterase
MGMAGYGLIASAQYAHALTHPGCIETGRTPADEGIESAQDVAYRAADGLILQAWYVPPQNGAVVVLLPGLGGGRDGLLREGAILAGHGYGLLATELRSCAHPRGQTTLGHREAEDLRAAVDWLDRQPDVQRVAALGYSLGGVAAILGSARDDRIEAVVAEGNFHDLAADITNAGHANPLWRSLLYRAVLMFLRRELGVNPQAISPIASIAMIGPRPLLLVYGELEAEDAHVQELFDQAQEPKSLWIVPNCGHGQYLNRAAAEWERRIIGFLDQAIGP